MPMTVIVFEDSKVSDLHPITVARPAYAITCAGFRLVDWLTQLCESTDCTLRGVVRPHLQTIQESDFKVLSVAANLTDDDWEIHDDGLLLVNARMSPSVSVGAMLRRLAKQGKSGVLVDSCDQSILVARVTGQDLNEIRKAAIVDGKRSEQSAMEVILKAAAKLDPIDDSVTESPIDVFRWPHDVVKCHMKQMVSSVKSSSDVGRLHRNGGRSFRW